MNRTDYQPFTTLLNGVAEYYGKTLTAFTIQLWWNALSGFDLVVVRKMLDSHVKHSRFMPAISEMLDAMRALDGRPGPEEAWAMVPKDESATAVWTDEMREAYAAASSLLAEGDSIAARMAFKESYVRAVERAREAAKPARWIATLGHDVHARERVLLDAQERGRLSAGYVAGLLPYRDAQDSLRLPAPETMKRIDGPRAMPPSIRAQLLKNAGISSEKTAASGLEK